MTDDQQPPKKARAKSSPDAARIDELFLLADLATKRGKNMSLDEQRQRKRARQRLSHILEQDQNGLSVDDRATHDWIIDVLSDLAAYANRQGLVQLEETLRITQFAAIMALRGKDEV